MKKSLFITLILCCSSAMGIRDVFTDFAKALEKLVISSQKTAQGIPFSQTQLEKLIHTKINEVRKREGLESLEWNETLATIARTHSEDMARRHYFAHDTKPDPTNKNVAYHNPPSGFEWRYELGGFTEKVLIKKTVTTYPDGSTQIETESGTGAENIFKIPLNILVNNKRVYEKLETIAQKVVDEWMKSKGHRENILTNYWVREGIGIAFTVENNFEMAYVTQNFC